MEESPAEVKIEDAVIEVNPYAQFIYCTCSMRLYTVDQCMAGLEVEHLDPFPGFSAGRDIMRPSHILRQALEKAACLSQCPSTAYAISAKYRL